MYFKQQSIIATFALICSLSMISCSDNDQEAIDTNRPSSSEDVNEYSSRPNSSKHESSSDLGISNISIGKSTTQSSNFDAVIGHASAANDGITDGNWKNGSVSHTKAERNPWWQIDLGAEYDVEYIRIWNRTDCCQSRLNDLEVYVGIEEIKLNAGQPDLFINSFDGKEYVEIEINSIGRFIRIEKSATGEGESVFLSLAEVEIMGTPY